MKIALDSDFRDFYDHWFDRPPCDYVLDRRSNPAQGILKRHQFELLERIGFTTPLHGLAKDIWPKAQSDFLVLYEEESLHCGQGKRLISTQEVTSEVETLYASSFIPTTSTPLQSSVSWRLLAIGDRLFWLTYKSNNWMSNHATQVDILVSEETLSRAAYALECGHDFSILSQYPLFAVDFVKSPNREQLIAVDFNPAPGLKGTGVEELIAPINVVKLISDFVAY